MTRQINAAEARAFFAHPSQHKGADLAELTDDGVVYFADGPVCGAFRDYTWPRVLDAHYGVMPESWGRLVPHAKAILRSVWARYEPDLIVGHTHETNRAALAFNRRCGFKPFGTMPTPDRVVLQFWRLECQ